VSHLAMSSCYVQVLLCSSYFCGSESTVGSGYACVFRRDFDVSLMR
jgi:hypothetical protein